jgi:hypothetical protein
MEYEAQKRLFLANHEYSSLFPPITINQHFQVLVSGSQLLEHKEVETTIQ